jgi:polar amino acid transport system substrate-binding protein
MTMRPMTRLRSAVAGLAACIMLLALGAAAHAADVPAGAEKTKITDWTDPRPTDWAKKYPLFAPVILGDGSLKRMQDAGVLRVCASVGSRPYAFIDTKTQQIIGGDVDLAKAVIALLGIARLEYVNTEFPSLIPALQAKRCDAIAASLVIRSDRAAAPGVRYSAPYGLIFDELVVRKDSPYQKIEDLKGQKVASVAGSTDLGTLQAQIVKIGGGIETMVFNGSSECFLAVVEKLAAGCMYDDGSTVGALQQYDTLRALDALYTYVPIGKYVDEPKVNPYVFGAVGMVTQDKDNDLNRALSVAIRSLSADGSQKRILQQWGMWHDGEASLVRTDN